MTAPSEDQKLANERTDHMGRPRSDPEVPKESFEQGSRNAKPVEREGVPREKREDDIERA